MSDDADSNILQDANDDPAIAQDDGIPILKDQEDTEEDKLNASRREELNRS